MINAITAWHREHSFPEAASRIHSQAWNQITLKELPWSRAEKIKLIPGSLFLTWITLFFFSFSATDCIAVSCECTHPSSAFLWFPHWNTQEGLIYLHPTIRSPITPKVSGVPAEQCKHCLKWAFLQAGFLQQWFTRQQINLVFLSDFHVGTSSVECTCHVPEFHGIFSFFKELMKIK